MRRRNTILIIAVLIYTQLMAQGISKITGPLGIVHITTGYTYADTTGTDSVLVQDQFRFGDMVMPNQASDFGISFQTQVDSCIEWGANRVIGLIQPLTEMGVDNQPGDTSLYFPYPISRHPGIIQGGERLSELSRIYGPFCGAVLDDWNGDTVTTREVRDALHGKTLDASGNVDENSEAITPENKLYAVIYVTDFGSAATSLVDGFFYQYYQWQNCCYTNLDGDIDALRSNYPGKEIMIAIYIMNSALGWTDPVSVQYMLQHALDRYDDGDINGVLLFAGGYLDKETISLSQWNAYALPYWLDSVYYPFLGAGQGRVTACYNDTVPLTGTFVRIFCRGSVSGDTLMRSRQITDANGQYQFGVWAGNRNTDSTYYWAVAEKAGYLNDTAGFWIKRGDTTNVPNIYLCPEVYANRVANNMLLFPNPSNGQFTIEANIVGEPYAATRIYNMQGQLVFTGNGPSPLLTVNLSWLADGVYIVEVITDNKKEHLQQMLVIQH